ncbi:MAG: serine/threonine-protein kinase [Planctomycetota bacterium]
MAIADEAEPELDELDRLVLAFLERYEEEGLDALEELCTRHPQHAAALRPRVAGLLRTGLVAGEAEEAFPERLGDFRLLSHLGGGGMGVVYLARQESLGRDVALKLIRPDHLYFPDARQRFRREVDLVARLQHPGIVPVYTVGEQNGLPYFAMERVRGCTLAEALVELGGRAPRGLTGRDLGGAVCAVMERAGLRVDEPLGPLFEGTWAEACLQIAKQVGIALDHAHRQGVLHRDVKPSNVLLTPEGRALLFDFGLSSGDEATPITRSGAELGSLPYMAPEQHGGTVDRRSDVYQLGASLHELLTLERPFAGLSASDVRDAVRRRGLRELDAGAVGAPHDAAPVLAKATALRQEDRYASAADFARDLDNVLALRPTDARPAGTLLRLRRAAQRNPERAAALVLGALLVIGGPLGFGVQRALAARETEEALGQAEQERSRAEANLDVSLAAVRDLLAETADKDLLEIPGMSATRLRLLSRARELFEGLLEQRPDDPKLRIDLAAIRHHEASALELLGRLDEAEELNGAAIDALRALRPEYDARGLRVVLAASLSQRAWLHERRLRPEECLRDYVEAEELALALVADAPDRGAALSMLRNYRGRRAEALIASGYNDEAQRVCELSVETSRELLEHDGRSDRALEEAGAALGTAGHVLSQIGDRARALERCAEARELLEELVARTGKPTHERDLAQLLTNYASVVAVTGDFAEAVELSDLSLELFERLQRDYPQRTSLRRRGTSAVANAAGLLLLSGQLDEALPLYRQAIELRQGLVDSVPGDGKYRVDLARDLQNLGMTCTGLGLVDEALESNERAVELYEQLVAETPSDLWVSRLLGYARITLANAHAATFRYPDFDALRAELDRRCPGEVGALGMVAMVAARCRTMAREDPGLDAGDRAAKELEYFELTLTLLEEALDGGYRYFQSLDASPELAEIRATPEYKALLGRYQP